MGNYDYDYTKVKTGDYNYDYDYTTFGKADYDYDYNNHCNRLQMITITIVISPMPVVHCPNIDTMIESTLHLTPADKFKCLSVVGHLEVIYADLRVGGQGRAAVVQRWHQSHKL